MEDQAKLYLLIQEKTKEEFKVRCEDKMYNRLSPALAWKRLEK